MTPEALPFFLAQGGRNNKRVDTTPALEAAERGSVYLGQFPGTGGKLLFAACMGSVFLAGAKILDCLRFERAAQLSKDVAAFS